MIVFSHTRARTLAACVALTALAACGGSSDDATGVNPGDTPGGTSTSTVRIVNATNGLFDVATGGSVAAENANLGYHGSTACLVVNSANPQVTIRQSGTNVPIAFTPSFTAGHRYTVIAYPTPTGGTLFGSVDTGFTPASGQAGINIFNGAAGSGNLVAVSNGMTIGSGQGVGYGTAGAFTSIAAGTQAITFRTETDPSSVLDAGTQTFFAGVNSTLVVAPGEAGGGYRTFTVSGC
jgi:hypothetical protein